MTTAVIILLVLALLGWAVFRKRSFMEEDTSDLISTKPTAENLSEPIISYSLYVVDTRINRRIEMQAPNEYLNQFGILNGQTIELHWNVLNADWISIEGVGYVQAIGRKEFYPTSNTNYKIIARNRNHITQQEFFVRVFPVPVMKKLSVPMPELASHHIHLFRQPLKVVEKLQPLHFPTLNIPSVIQIGKENLIEKPKKILLHNIEVPHLVRNDSGKEFSSFKTKLFDRMESTFKDNYKLKDILQTIRKHYE